MNRREKVLGMFFAALAVTLPAQGTINDDTVRTLKLAQFEAPEYPAALRAAGIAEGVTTVAIARDQDRVADVLVIDSTRPEFAEAALKAVGHWRFQPESSDVADAEAPHPIIVRFYFSFRGVVWKVAADNPRQLSQISIDTSGPRLPTFEELDSQPKARQQPMPQFPGKLRGRAAPGTATVEFFVDENGRARVPVVTSATAPEFGEAARSAVSQWSYDPPRQRGRPVIAVGRWQFQFGQEPGT